MCNLGLVILDVDEGVEGKELIGEDSKYTSRAPIVISSNAGFTSANGVTGGNGTIWSPWIIEGWEINGTGHDYCIYIYNTVDYYIIRDCKVFESDEHGIFLSITKNGLIQNTNVSRCFYGVTFWSSFSTNITLENNEFWKNNYGIYFNLARPELADTNHIRNNTFYDNFMGIYLRGSNNHTIYNNHFLYLSRFRLEASGYNVITGNNFMSKSNGISIMPGSSLNQIFHNNFYGIGYESEDNFNFWNLSYPYGGNYWDDYQGKDSFSGISQDIIGKDGMGDTPYSKDFLIDYYPIIRPYVWDGVVPSIVLEELLNNSFIIPGVNISFDIWDGNLDLEYTNFSINRGLYEPFSTNYTINTNNWTDGKYVVQIYANDTSGRTTERFYNFSVDLTAPIISLSNPENNFIIPSGTQLDFEITDPHIGIVNYTINNGDIVDFDVPYDIDTTGWNDDTYYIEINANDTVMNAAMKSYNFTIDSTLPAISLVSPANNSIIQSGIAIIINVTDEHRESVFYSINGEPNQTVATMIYLNTRDWVSGEYLIEVQSFDKAGNNAIAIYCFTVDITSPTVTSMLPVTNALGVPVNTTLTIFFDEPMNTSSVENLISFSPLVNISDYEWGINNDSLSIIFSSDLTKNTSYTLIIDRNAKDINGNSMSSNFTGVFTTWLDNDDDGIPDETDSDDDNDGVLDENDYDPLDPDISEDPNASTGDFDMLWVAIIAIIVIAGALGAAMFLRKTPEPVPQEPEAVSEESETTLET